jgi:hypothetical protein
VIRAVVITLLAAAIPAAAAETPTPLAPLAAVMRANPSANAKTGAYVALRCAALYTYFAGGLEKSDTPSLQTLGKRYERIGELFYNHAVALGRGEGSEPARAGLAASAQMLDFGLAYNARAEAARQASGNMFSDPLIAADREICKTLAE